MIFLAFQYIIGILFFSTFNKTAFVILRFRWIEANFILDFGRECFKCFLCMLNFNIKIYKYIDVGIHRSGLYPLFKRFTYWPQAWLGMCSMLLTMTAHLTLSRLSSELGKYHSLDSEQWTRRLWRIQIISGQLVVNYSQASEIHSNEILAGPFTMTRATQWWIERMMRRLEFTLQHLSSADMVVLG